MAVRKYKCPECAEPFTASKIENNNNRCPNCGRLLEHKVDGNKMVWSVVPEAVSKTPIDKRDPRYEVYEQALNFRVFRLKKRRDDDNAYNIPDFRVVFSSVDKNLNLHCPRCGHYLHTPRILSVVASRDSIAGPKSRSETMHGKSAEQEHHSFLL